ncbi:MAG TPA: amidase [Casimicrobiaceae bacterium]|nr:amidase [Casimicrobiaceae bacterium]
MDRAQGAAAAVATAPNDLCRLSAAALGEGYTRGVFSPVDVVEAVLARINEVNERLNAIVTLDATGARAAARASERRWREGHARGPLDGVPLTIKDNLNVRGLRTTWGSRLYADFVPTIDEVPVARARDAGLVIVGKTNVPEFTLSGYTDNLLFGPTRNPWNTRLTPGGSSGGAVACVASGIGPLALGTDGGGSIRRPVSHTGLVGLKPSRGRVPRGDGLPQILLDFEVVGPLARTMRDLVLTMEAIAQSWAPPPAKRCRILYVPRFGTNPVDAEIAASVAQAASVFSRLGHAVVEASVPFDADAFNAVWPIVSQTGLAALLNTMRDWRERVAPAFVEMADAGSKLRATDLFDALAEIACLRERLSAAFDDSDVLLTPAAAALPWPAEIPYPPTIDGKEAGPRGHAVYTAFANASGCPAIAVPCMPSANGLPIGFQLVAAPGQDERLCVLAAEYESAEPWSHRWPPL